jgi:hypothetical protein
MYCSSPEADMAQATVGQRVNVDYGLRAVSMSRTWRTDWESCSFRNLLAYGAKAVAKQFGFDNWNILAAKMTDTGKRPKASEGVELFGAIPVIRMFDVGKAKEFYVDFLGFTVDWDWLHL